MPANYTHLSFGKEVIKKIENPTIQELITRNYDLFVIGLHGPDILFYHYPLKDNDIKKYGHTMHDLPAYDFFGKNKECDEKSLAYLYGFICHFVLDSKCHGLVEECVTKTKRSHYEVEAQLEKYLMKKDNVSYLTTNTASHIRENESICLAIGKILRVESSSIQKALNSMIYYHKILVPGKIKDIVIRCILSLSGQGSLKGLMLDVPTLSIDDSNNHQLYTLYLESIPKAVELLDNYYHYVHGFEELNHYFCKNYL